MTAPLPEETPDARESPDHGGNLDAAIARYGGTRADWLDLSTGINPVPYPVGDISQDSWTRLPDQAATDRLLVAARQFWKIPDAARIVAAPGASALIARMPDLTATTAAHIPGPTYNEHARAFSKAGFPVNDPDRADSNTHVYVHPNNPDGRLWGAEIMGGRSLTIVDESFCDTIPDQSHVPFTGNTGIVVLKSFGKFWGLAGLRLGFAIGTPKTLAPPGLVSLTDLLGPWPVSGPALDIGARALEDHAWAKATRARLAQDATCLDTLLTAGGAHLVGGTPLFRLYQVDDAARWQNRLAEHRVWSRIFPYSKTWLRLGLPAPDRWDQLRDALP
ncbi:threonine-phosphate decarboxylase [Aestuariibius sp. 2305UL40-4]|uniref:threonine-phosphate decarboxylase n=1 Tax=Aestuariibius violaceus TaxID=3234132 RepID=UPI00345E6001